jgi:outer membrane protein TolC
MGVRGLAAFGLSWAMTLSAGASPGGDVPVDHPLTIEEVVQVALDHNPDLQARRSNARADRDDARSTRGRLLPSVSASVLYDDASSPEKINAGALLGAQGAGIAPIAIQNFDVGLGLFTASQPLLGLLHLSQEYAARTEHADAAEATLRAREADLRQEVESDVLSLFEARAVRGIAQASFDQLSTQLQTTEARLADKMLTRADILRVKVALANADQERIQADVQEQISRASLLTAMGLPPDDETVQFAEPEGLLPSAETLDTSKAQLRALRDRPEVQAALSEGDAAHHDRLASELKLLPEINATAMYIRVQGLPSGLPPNYTTVGLSLDWTLWEWGASYFKSHAASEREDAARSQIEVSRSQVKLEVIRRRAEERSAAHAVAVAGEAIDQAQEAFRVTVALMQAGAATITDVLDAQSALTQSQLNSIRARYQDLRARSSLRRALGN